MNTERKLLLQYLLKQYRQSLKQAVTSQKLRDFITLIKKSGYSKGLPKGIKWDLLTDDDVTIVTDDNVKKLINNDEYLILWMPVRKTLVKHKGIQYTKWGTQRDKSIYIAPTSFIATQARKFLNTGSLAYDEVLQYKTAQNNYDKPANGVFSVKTLAQLDTIAIAIKYSTLEQYSSSDLRAQRYLDKKDALIFKKATDIIWSNKMRYRELLKASKVKKQTAELSAEMQSTIDKLNAKIQRLSKMTIQQMVTYTDKDVFNDELSYKIPVINKSNLTKLQSTAKIYKDLVYAYGYYIKSVKDAIELNGSSYYAREREKYQNKLRDILATI